MPRWRACALGSWAWPLRMARSAYLAGPASCVKSHRPLSTGKAGLQLMLNRRQFAIGSAAAVSGGLVGGLAGSRFARGNPLRFDRRLPIPPLIDAVKQGNAVKLKVSSGRHAFLKGKLTQAYGYSGPVLGPAIRMPSGDEVQIT